MVIFYYVKLPEATSFYIRVWMMLDTSQGMTGGEDGLDLRRASVLRRRRGGSLCGAAEAALQMGIWGSCNDLTTTEPWESLVF